MGSDEDRQSHGDQVAAEPARIEPLDPWERESAFAILALAIPPVRPPAGLKERLMGSLRSSGSRPKDFGPVPVRAGVTLVRTELIPWEQAHPGVRIRRLPADPASSDRCLMVEIAPRSAFPDHEHQGFEEVFVLRGSMSVAGRRLQTGDLCRSEAGTKDWEITTEEGTLLFVRLGPSPRPEPGPRLDSAEPA
ncbi:MAG: cupin domain-containing protein [Acidobacteriota bacterium]